jgi:hypothetical protein
MGDQVEHGQLTEARLRTEIVRRSREGEDGLTRDSLNELLGAADEPSDGGGGFLRYAFDSARDSEIVCDEGIVLLDHLLADKAPLPSAKEPPTRPSELLRVGAPNVIDYADFASPSRPSPLFSTGCEIFDRLIGGQADGETYGFIAPIGAGKTTVAIQLAVATARILSRAADNGGTLRHSYFFSYEDTIHAHACRALCFASEIDRDQGSFPPVPQSCRGSLKPYEIERYRREGKCDIINLPGERERLEAAYSDLNRNFHLVDFNSLSKKGPGYRGIAEIKAYLETQIEKSGHQPGMVVIDYCGKAVEREIEFEGGDLLREFSGRIGEFTKGCRTSIASHFGVPVWITHQVRGAAIGKPANAELGVGDAAESRVFADSLNFLFAMAQPDSGHHVARLNLAKSSRNFNSARSELVRVNGPFARIDPAGAEYTVDSRTRRITPILANNTARTSRRATRRDWNL